MGGSPSQLEIGARHAAGLLPDGAGGLLMTFYARQNLDNVSGKLANVFGSRVVNALWDSRTRSTQLKVVADRDTPPFSWHGPVLLVYPSARTMGRVAEIEGVTAEVVVPWTAEKDDIRQWIRAWSPAPIGSAGPSPMSGVLSPVVREALRSLTSFVNFNNVLVTSSDKAEAIGTFETLLAFEGSLDSSEVRAWLVGHEQWPAEMADRAADIIDDLCAGKRIRGRRGPDRRRYDVWCQRASESEPAHS